MDKSLIRLMSFNFELVPTLPMGSNCVCLCNKVVHLEVTHENEDRHRAYSKVKLAGLIPEENKDLDM